MARILVVDDDVDLAEQYQTLLQAAGYEVRCAYSAGEARDVVESFPPDLAVLDVMMESPVAGFELARELHRKWPQMPIFMVTGVHEATSVPFRFEPEPTWLPVVKVIDKPVDHKALLQEIEGTLRKS